MVTVIFLSMERSKEERYGQQRNIESNTLSKNSTRHSIEKSRELCYNWRILALVTDHFLPELLLPLHGFTYYNIIFYRPISQPHNPTTLFNYSLSIVTNTALLSVHHTPSFLFSSRRRRLLLSDHDILIASTICTVGPLSKFNWTKLPMLNHSLGNIARIQAQKRFGEM